MKVQHMPVTTKRLARGIYSAEWHGFIKIDEVYNASDAIDALAQEDKVLKYITVLTGNDIKQIPLDIRIMSQTVSKSTYAILAYNSPFAGELLGRMFNKLMPIQVKFFRDWDTLIAHANELLEELSHELS
ncbi:MAG: hypothetical protein AAFV93_08940 [Chloroflexota bacterium]